MTTRAGIAALAREVATLLTEAGLSYALQSLEDVPAKGPVPAHRHATWTGPSGRQLAALFFDVADELRLGLRVHDTLTTRTVYVHAFLKHVNRPVAFDDFNLDARTYEENIPAAAAKLVALLIANPRLVSVLDGSDWIDVPFDWAGMK